MNNSNLVSDPRFSSALTAYRDAVGKASNLLVQKDATNVPGYDTALGLQARSLEAPAKLLYPLTAILRRMIPRVKPNPVSKLLEWKVITAINTGSLWASIAEGASGTINKKSEKDKSATLKSLGVRDYVTYESQFYGTDFQDIKALGVLTNLQTLMVTEEDVIIGGNITALTPPAAPSGVAAAGGALPVDAVGWSIKVSPLTLQGYRQSQLVGYDPFTNTTGEGLPSAASAAVPTVLNDKVTFTWVDVPTAVGYNAFIQQGGAGTWKFSGTVTVNAFVLSATTQIGVPVVNVADGSANALDYDGILAQYNSSGSGAYITTLNNAVLTSDGLGGVTQLTDAMQSAYAASGVGPNYWIMEPRIHRKIISLIAGSTAPVYRVNLTDGNSEIKGGMSIRSLLNPFTGEDVELISHRTFPPNMIIGLRLTNPYDYANLANAIDMAVVQDYYQVDFAVEQTSGRVWPFGVFANEVLRVYFAGGGVILKNVNAA